MRKIFALLFVLSAVSCGDDGGGYGDRDGGPSPPPPAPTPGPADAAWEKIQPVIEANCGKCHNGVVHPLRFTSAAVFKGSKAKTRLLNGTMPPPGNPIKAADKAALLSYLNG